MQNNYLFLKEDVSKQFSYITSIMGGNENEQQSDILLAQLSQAIIFK